MFSSFSSQRSMKIIGKLKVESKKLPLNFENITNECSRCSKPYRKISGGVGMKNLTIIFAIIFHKSKSGEVKIVDEKDLDAYRTYNLAVEFQRKGETQKAIALYKVHEYILLFHIIIG